MSRASQTTASQKLDFKEKLIDKGKRESTDSLLRKLKTLHQKLAALEQDATDTKSLDPVKAPLINQIILHHKDRGVKAYAACCLADMLRLYAPDAPYTLNELRDIFQFFSAQLLINLKPPPPNRPLQPSRSKTNQGTEDSASQSQLPQSASQRVTDIPYYPQYCYLLESLSTIKSIVLACDVPGGDDLVIGFFEGFTQIVRMDMSKSIIRHLSSILVALLEESASVPAGVMDCIVEQLAKGASRPETPSFQLIVDVCNGASQRLQRSVFAHFADIQMNHGKNPTSEDMDVMRESHQLIILMWRNCPNVLPMVIPTLEENLRAADQTDIRELTTRTLASMFGYKPRIGLSVAELARAYPTTWRAWLGRKVDKSTQVRLAWASSSVQILAQIPDLRKELEAELVDRITDSNEHVRAEICAVYGALDFETTLHQISLHTLKAISARMSDKKAEVRNKAAQTLSKLWSAAYSEIETGEEAAVAQFAWIPEDLLHRLQVKDLPVEGRTALTHVLKSNILPLPDKPDDEQAWVDRLLLVAQHLDEHAMNGLCRATGLWGYARGSSPYRAFILFCEENNGGIIEKDEDIVKARLAFVINAIATLHFAEPEKAKRDMEAFASANESRLYKLFKTAVEPQTDLRALIKAKNELLRRIEQSHTDILATFSTILEHGAFNILNTTSVSPLLRTLQTPPSGPSRDSTIASVVKLIALIAKECPPMFTSHVSELNVCIGQQKNEKLVEVALQALAATSKFDDKAALKASKHIDKVIKIALNGTPRQAKFAARFLAYSGAEEGIEKLIDGILDGFSSHDEKRLLTYLRGLAELALSAPKALEARADEVHRFVMKEVIYRKSSSSEDTVADEWIDENKLDLIDQAKLIGLRVVTHRAIGFARDPGAAAVAQPVLQLLGEVLQGDGQINESTQEGGHAKTHIRLRAALCLVKMAQVKAFDKRMTPFFEYITYIMQDPCFQVRHKLLLKMGEVLPAQRMLTRWNVMPAMIATDPETDNPSLARNIITSCVRACRNIPANERIERIELPLARLLLVLAHHPDLEEWNLGITKDMAKYIELYLDCIISRDNVGMLYHIAAKVKSVRGLDPAGNPEEDNTNLYKLAELSQLIIRNRAETHHWSVTTYPGKLKLPSDIFHNLPNNQVALETTRKTFLTEEEANWAKNLGKRPNATAGPSRRIETGRSSPKRRSKPAKPSQRKRARKSAETTDDDEDEESEDESEGTEAEDAEEESSAVEEEGAEPVFGRGGKRAAKTRAKNNKKNKKVKKLAKVDSDVDMDEEGSELSAVPDE